MLDWCPVSPLAYSCKSTGGIRWKLSAGWSTSKQTSIYNLSHRHHMHVSGRHDALVNYGVKECMTLQLVVDITRCFPSVILVVSLWTIYIWPGRTVSIADEHSKWRMRRWAVTSLYVM
jgi:hypothetical protein